MEKTIETKHVNLFATIWVKTTLKHIAIMTNKTKHEDYVVTKEICATCKHYKSRYIEYPITVTSIIQKPINNTPLGSTIGTWVSINPCGEEYKNQTYLGILIGDLPLQTFVSFKENTGELIVDTMKNPCIYVPALKKIIYGAESWWTEIDSPEDIKDITNKDIDNT